MENKRGACLVCGKPLVYYENAREMECSICHKIFENNVSCEDDHYVCDDCHSKRGIEVIEEMCRGSKSRNPITLMQEIMENPYIYMHGPEHHVLVGAAILTTFCNCGGNLDYEWAMTEMVRRGKEVPGGICGFWGCCGAAVSTGIAYSILKKATPLSGKSWGQSNLMTARALESIGSVSGPRCCKRDSFLAVVTAAEVIREEFGVELEIPEKIQCTFDRENEQCIRRICPFYMQGA
ncbi:MAG: DUF5714 domain-containing protein [Lachnoclostridium sp.]|nr:DUF5714 domain-containing protein [Lachnoclostridium sp.]